MVTRRDFLKQIGKAAVGGTMFAARAAQIKERCPVNQLTSTVVIRGRNPDHPISELFHAHEKCRSCRMPKCASTTGMKIDLQIIDLEQLCDLLYRNKQGIAEIIQTGNLNGRKVFYQVDHKMGPSRIPLSPIS